MSRSNSIRTVNALLKALLSASAFAGAAASDLGAGGAYKVYVGSAFYTRELVDSSKWSYVARTTDGLYWHPVGYAQDTAYKNATPAQWKTIGTYFASKDCLIEGDMGAGRPNGNIGAIRLVKSLGFTPTVALVNRVKDTLGSWQQDIDTDLTQGVQDYTMFGGGATAKPLGFLDPAYAEQRKLILQGYGSSVDAPTYLFVHEPPLFRHTILQSIDWVHQNKKKYCYLISPNVSADSFLIHSQILTRTLEDSGDIPDQFGVELYGLRPYTLTPESVPGKNGELVSANTITGVAHWLLRHARADQGELDLWVVGPDQKAHGKGTASEDLSKVTPVAMSGWTGSKGAFTYSILIQNNSDWLDFIPCLKAGVSGFGTGWTLTFQTGGKDVTQELLGNGHVFRGAERLMPGNTRTVTATMTKPGATTLPATAQIQIQLLPYPGSSFVRDVAVLRHDSTPTSLAPGETRSPENALRITPGRDGLVLENPGNSSLAIHIHDLSGHLLYAGEAVSGQSRIALGENSARVLVVRIGTGGQLLSRVVLVPN